MYDEYHRCDNENCADNVMGICTTWETYDMDTYGCDDHYIDDDI